MGTNYTFKNFKKHIFTEKELINMMCHNDYDINDEQLLKKIIRSIFYATYIASVNIRDNSSAITHINLMTKEIDRYVTEFIKSLTDKLKD